MDGSELGSLFSQLPAGVWLVPLIGAVLYITFMVYLFRRSAERRRRARELKESRAPQSVPPDELTKPANPSRMARLQAFSDSEASGELSDLDDLLSADFDVRTPGARSTPESDPIAELVEPVPSLDSDPTPPIAEVSVTPEPAITPGAEPGDAVEVMRVWRDLSDGTLIIQMGNERYRSAGEIRNPDLLRRFTALVRELWAMVSPASGEGTNSTRPVAVPPPAKSTTSPAPAPSALPPLKWGSTEPIPPPKPPRFGRVRKPEPAQPTVIGIAQEIEEFLQNRLERTSEFSDRSIHIRQSPDHGIMIEVDGQYFEGVSDVTDPAVREYLLNMMREWENRK